MPELSWMLFLSNPEMLMQAARENRNEIFQISRIKGKITQQYNRTLRAFTAG